MDVTKKSMLLLLLVLLLAKSPDSQIIVGKICEDQIAAKLSFSYNMKRVKIRSTNHMLRKVLQLIA